VEVEGRQGIGAAFRRPPLPYQELKIATAERGGQVNALAIDIEDAFLEYLDMFYNLGMRAGRCDVSARSSLATTIAPGLRDVLLTGKIKETVVRLNKGQEPVYDAIVVDAPPTGASRVSWTSQGGVRSRQGRPGALAERWRGEAAALRSDRHPLVTAAGSAAGCRKRWKAIEELAEMDLPIGSVIVNRNIPSYLEPATWQRPPKVMSMRTRCGPV